MSDDRTVIKFRTRDSVTAVEVQEWLTHKADISKFGKGIILATHELVEEAIREIIRSR